MKFSIKVGDIFTNSKGEEVVVISYKSYREIKVKFSDDFKHELVTTGSQLKSGSFKNPFYKTVAG